MAKKIILPEYIPGTLRMYLDGSALTARHDPSQPGGWGVYLVSTVFGDRAFQKGAKNTTISRMEMEAMSFALNLTMEYSKLTHQKIQIYSDSQMVVRSINLGWLKNWARARFTNRTNADIWKEIWGKLQELKRIKANYEIIHMSGHQKNLDHPHVFGNNIADMLADYKQYK